MTVIDHLIQSINIRTNNGLALRHGLQDDPWTAFCIRSHEQDISLPDDFSDLLVRYGSYEDYIVDDAELLGQLLSGLASGTVPNQEQFELDRSNAS
jgi:hypothetical protein